MEQQYPHSPWYDQSLPAGRAAAVGSPETPKKNRKKRTGWKIAVISVCVLILIAASVYAFSDELRFRWFVSTPNGTYSGHSKDWQDDASRGGDGDGYLPDVDDDGYARDFRDFFSSYYSPVEESPADSRIPRSAAATDFRLTPVSPEGKLALSLQALYTACADTVVGVRAASGTGLYTETHWGSGFIVSPDGFIITNQHVISDTDTAVVVLTDGTEHDAVLVGEDVQTDVALLKIEAEGLPFAEIGDSRLLAVGDDVVAIGNPLGANLSGTMTNGIISAIDRSISYNGHYMPMLQTNTALNEGNSGGPLFNMYGQVVGITNMKMSSAFSEVTIEGIGFAIPTSTVKKVTDQLFACGTYVRPGLGITVGAIPEDVGKHYSLPEGLYISAVSDGSSAQEQGVQVGDVLTHVNGIPVRATDDVLAIRDVMAVGDKMTLTIFRAGKTFDVVIELRELSKLY